VTQLDVVPAVITPDLIDRYLPVYDMAMTEHLPVMRRHRHWLRPE
jgi:hypothetical protein